MGIMKQLDELEQELYENGILELDKDDWITPTAKIWFSNTMKPEDYSGIFEGIKLEIYETKNKVVIKFNKESDADMYKASMNGLKSSLGDIVDILKEAKEGE